MHFFSPYGTVIDHQITQKDENKLSEGSGFVLFSSELAVIKILSNGNTVNLGGEKVSHKQLITKIINFCPICDIL